MVVGVYGTLKRGYSNYLFMERAGGDYIANAETVDKYPMYQHGIPFLMEEKGLGHHVALELFDVQDISPLDYLEGHPHLYKRKQIETTGGLAWVYFYQGDSIGMGKPIKIYNE